ncbi:MAG: trypsin-like peptidase domain-containing protein, partial [Caldilineaceae bacterium]
VVGALYGPLLLRTGSASAVQALQEQPSTPVAVPAINAALAADQEALATLFNAIVPSVVSIETAGEFNVADLPEGFPQDQLPDGLVPQGQGSGWIYDNEGHIVTNNHVVEGAQEVTVIFFDGTWADATVVATDPQADLAVLKVEPPAGFAWQPLQLADESALRVGHSVIAVGNPFGYESTMTTGIVSALGRSFPVGGFGESRYTLPDVVQTDAAINPGNSGGPLLNLAGELVGVNFAIESAVRANSGVGFAIPVSIVERVVPALIADGSFNYPYLGLSGTSVTPTLARELELENTQLGAYVATVIPGGPAEAAGVIAADPDSNEGGDIVVSFNGAAVKSFDEMVAALVTTASPGDTITLGVVRDGELLELPVTVGERPAPAAAAAATADDGDARVSAREAIAIAEEVVADEFDGEIVEKVATPETRDGAEVWVVELATETQSATVVVDRATGEVVELSIQ